MFGLRCSPALVPCIHRMPMHRPCLPYAHDAPTPIAPSMQRRGVKLFGARAAPKAAATGAPTRPVELDGLIALMRRHAPPFPPSRPVRSPQPPRATAPLSSKRLAELGGRLEPVVQKLLELSSASTRGDTRKRGGEGVAIAGVVVEGVAPFAAVGVNYTFHQLVLGGSSRTIPGLLKGCAEQNALGSLAASGLHRYEDVAELHLVAVRRRVWDPNGGLAPVLPCPACWSALCAIHAQRREASNGAKGLVVYVLLRDGCLLDEVPPHLAPHIADVPPSLAGPAPVVVVTSV